MAGMNFKTLIEGTQSLAGITKALIGLALVAVLGLVIVGAVVDVVQDGSVPIPNSTNTAIGTLLTSIETAVQSVFDQNTIIVGFVAVVLIGVIFGLGRLFDMSGSSGSGSSL